MTSIAAPTAPRRALRRPRLLAAAAVAAALAAVLPVVLAGRGGGTAWAAEALRVAQAAPRLLVGAPDWSVVRADEFSVDYGEMTFASGGRQLDLHWQRGGFVDTLSDRAAGADLATTAPADGRQARVYRYRGTDDFTALWREDGYTLEARGLAADVESFTALIGTLHQVGVDEWLSAMPASVVKPASRADAVRGMLDGVPLPPRFDAAALETGGALRDRYQLGAQVVGAVACAWIGRWVDGRRSGDDAAVRQAVGAMATSHDWKILREMQAQGDYPEVLWEYADAMAQNAPVPGGKPLTIEESYRQALGCP